MANLNQATSERGQLILVAAVVLAVTFVGLALVVNSVIFSENLATRGDVPGSSEALDTRYEVTQTVGTIMTAVHRDDDPRLDDIQEGIGDIRIQGGLQQARSGRVVDLSYVSHEAGQRLAQDNVSQLNSTDGDADWTLAEGVDTTRDVRFNFTEVNSEFKLVAEENNPLEPDDPTFWNMTVAPNENITVELNETGTSSETYECAGTSDAQFVDVTGATVDGERCQALERNGTGAPTWFGTGTGINEDGETFDISFEGSDDVNGTYSMIILGGGGLSLDLDEFANDSDDEIYYSITVDYRFVTHEVRYETEVEVAPGEVPP